MTLSFALSDDVVASYAGQQPPWGPIGYVTYKRTYARPLDTIYPRHAELAARHGLRETEEFWLTVTRVVEGAFSILKDHCRNLRLPWDEARGQTMAHMMFHLMWEFKFLPPGRGLWAMGSPVVAKVGGAALNNCAFVSTEQIDTDFSAPFCFLMDMSMLGVGVGGDCRGAGKVLIQEPACTGDVHVVQDTREGWVELVRRVLDAYVGKASLPIEVDYSEVRPAGSPIMTFGGTASGPEPLMRLYDDLLALLSARVGQAITSSDIVDIFNLVGRCVVAGNVRRSAEIMFGDLTDEAFLELKDRGKHGAAVDGWRWASNNSVLAEVGQGYAKHARLTVKNGEPGYFWLENARNFGRMGRAADYKDYAAMGGNPCLEQTLESFELCCLVETFPSRHKSRTAYLATIKMAYLYAKIVTLVSTHDPRTNAVLLRNRRIGCSMSGIVQAMSRFGRREFFETCDAAYGYIEEIDKEYSRWLCIPESVKKTSVKPSGTVSLLPGVTPGIHYPHSRYYLRVIRFATDSWIVPALRAAGYDCVDIDPEKEPNTVAVYFPVEVEDFDRSERDVSMWEQLENAAQMQTYWADNQVSVTVKFDPKTEGPQIRSALELYEVRLKGVSFLPHDDHGYEHAPYQAITRDAYEAYRARLRPYDLSSAGHEVTERFCDGDVCVL